MKPSKEYLNNIKNRIITEDMLSDCLHSVNKRAKNYRDKANEYKGYYGRYHRNVESQYDKMEHYYDYKESLLSHIKPLRIHKQFIGCKRVRVFSYEDNYYRIYYNKYKENKIVWENSYYDYETGDEVDFFDYETDEKRFLYFIYYEVGDKSFHSPIDNPTEHPELVVEEIDENFTTTGEDVENLISVQFVEKVLYMLDNMNCKLILKDKTIEFTDRTINDFPKKEQEPFVPPTEKQVRLIKGSCELYGYEDPGEISKGKAIKWLSKVFKEHSNLMGDLQKLETSKRNQIIYNKYKEGKTEDQLAEEYNLSTGTIKTILRPFKKQESENKK